MSDPDKLESLRRNRLKAERRAGLAAEQEQMAIQAVAFVRRAKLWDDHGTESRLLDLVAAVKEIIAMDGEPDWRGLLTEALEDAKQ